MTAAVSRLAPGLPTGETGAGPADSIVRWLVALGIFLVVLLVALVARRLFVRRLKSLAERTTTPVDDIVVAILRRYWTAAAVPFALALGARFAPLEGSVQAVVHRLFLSAFLVVLVLALSRVPQLWFQGRQRDGGDTPSSLLVTLARIAVFGAGALLVLDNLGVSITPLLTALGIGSLAVGLALQPTLSNLFAGVHLSMSRPLRVGDFVELEGGDQGHVIDIGWRATRLRQLSNNLLVVPNARLAEMRLVNYSLPEPEQSVVFPVGVAYGSDLDRVERVTLEVAREIQRAIPEADSAHEPFVRYAAFADSAITFNVILRGRSYTDRWPLIHAFVKALHARFRDESIEIPFPQRSVILREVEG